MPMEDSYRDHADTYADFSQDNPVNKCYDRPAILSLAGDVNGLRVLELGCAAGHLTERLAEAWRWNGVPVTAHMYRRSFSSIFAALRDSGFRVDVVDEPQPVDLPEAMDSGVRAALVSAPVFLFVSATLRG